jgi:hypothetical protein
VISPTRPLYTDPDKRTSLDELCALVGVRPGCISSKMGLRYSTSPPPLHNSRHFGVEELA